MSKYDMLVQFLETLRKSLDKLHDTIYHMSTRIRVEQELLKNAPAFPEESSAPTKSEAPLPESRQGGPEIFPGTDKERGRSQKAADKVRMNGPKMETSHGRS